MEHMKGRVYSLDVGDRWPDYGKALAQVPGLRLFPAVKRVEGCIDAVAAAEVVLGGPVRPLPEFERINLDGLREYQQVGVGWVVGALKKYGGALLSDEMGLGKTLQAICAARELTKDGGRIYVVCPAYLRSNWVAELEKWGVTDVVSLGPKKNKKVDAGWDVAKTAKWVVSSYDLGDKAFKAAFPMALPKLVIMDEAHYLTGRDSKRAKLLETVCALSPYKLALSGSPQRDRPRDLYQLLRLLFGRSFGGQFDYDVRYCAGIANLYGGLDNKGVSNADELGHRLSYYNLRRLKADVASDLPPLTRQVVWLDAEPKASRAFHNAISAKAPGAFYDALEATLNAKLLPVVAACAEAKRFLCFTWLKRDAHEIGRLLAQDYDTPCVVIDGDVPADKRLSILKQAESEQCGVVATIDSLSTGFTLSGIASQGFFHALDPVPSKMAQAEARIHRIGQTRNVVWTYFAVRESMDELVVKNIIDKLDAHHAVLGDGGEMSASFQDADAADVLAELLESL